MSPRRAKAVRGRVGDDPATALREHLIDTAEKLLAEQPVSAITTRDIARTAGLSDGVLYNYFADKNELLVTALTRRFATALERFERDLPRPGTETVEHNLVRYAQATLDLVASTLPIAGGLMSELTLLHRFIGEIHSQPFGPQRMRQPIADYLVAEQQLGRLGEFDPEPVITLIIGPAVVLGFNGLLLAQPQYELSEQLPAIVHTLLHGLNPPSAG
jgi:AcrR family transcriptional regulator